MKLACCGAILAFVAWQLCFSGPPAAVRELYFASQCAAWVDLQCEEAEGQMPAAISCAPEAVVIRDRGQVLIRIPLSEGRAQLSTLPACR